MTSLRNRAGLSLIEVMIAVSLLSIGVLGAAALQSSALQGTAKAEQLQNITGIAESEIHFRRQIRPTASSSKACKAGTPDGYTCSVEITACTITGGAFSCSGSVNFPDAYLVSVTSTGPRGDSTTVTTYVAYDATYADAYDYGGNGTTTTTTTTNPTTNPTTTTTTDPTTDPLTCWPPGHCTP